MERTGLALTVLLTRYFGSRSGGAALSTIWMPAGTATAGPADAGSVADLTGSFTPALAVLGLILLPISVAASFMGLPIMPSRPALFPNFNEIDHASNL
ncbi:MAG: Major facilitator transporter [Rhodospirillales bacterium]|nr:Major facilitator transporter [Rhodospirillales bacterium]